MPDIRSQVYISSGGVLKVHDNVVFEANTADEGGGAVSLPFDTVLLLPAVVFCDKCCENWFDPLRQFTSPRRKGWWLSSIRVATLFQLNHPRTQVRVATNGELTVQDNVVFEANTAGVYGGAVSFQFDTLHSLLLWCFAIELARVGLVR